MDFTGVDFLRVLSGFVGGQGYGHGVAAPGKILS